MFCYQRTVDILSDLSWKSATNHTQGTNVTNAQLIAWWSVHDVRDIGQDLCGIHGH